MNTARKIKFNPEFDYQSTQSGVGIINRHSGLTSQAIKQVEEPSVAILLCIYQGKNYLEEQLESIGKQTHKNWKLYVSEDGDCEESRRIIEKFSNKFEAGRIRIVKGPQEGFAKNFLSLTCDPTIEAEFFAFSDQDDIWHINKLQTAIRLLNRTNNEIPALYCSRTVIVDRVNKEIGLSPLFSKAPSFANALVQNIGGGNTMLFNKKARGIALQVGKDVPVVAHDWWMYLLVSGCEGNVIYDPNPSLRYRQHESNIVGCNIGWAARFYRIYLLLRGRFKEYNDRNIKSLAAASILFTPENQNILNKFTQFRMTSILNRLFIFRTLEVYRQTLLGNLGLWAAVIINKL